METEAKTKADAEGRCESLKPVSVIKIEVVFFYLILIKTQDERSVHFMWFNNTGADGVGSNRKVRRQAQRQGRRQAENAKQRQTKEQEKQKQTVAYVKPVPIRYSAQNYDDYDDTYDDSCCSHSGCSEQPYDHDFFGMCVQRYGVYHGSKKQMKQSKQSAHSTKPKASGKDVYRLAKNSLIS